MSSWSLIDSGMTNFCFQAVSRLTGGVAQVVRAPALQVWGPEFKPPLLQKKILQVVSGVHFLAYSLWS
jgi:hypothetical protein